MSVITNPINTGNQMTSVYNLQKIFLWDNRYDASNYVNNGGYNPVTLFAGTIMGKIAATGVLAPCDASANDGSQFPIGVLAQDITLLGGATKNVNLCISGDVNEAAIIYYPNGNNIPWVAANKTINIAGRALRDRLMTDTLGIRPVPSTEMTQADN